LAAAGIVVDVLLLFSIVRIMIFTLLLMEVLYWSEKYFL